MSMPSSTITSLSSSFSQPSPDDLVKLGEILDIGVDQLRASLGESFVVERGQTWAWPPKVSLRVINEAAHSLMKRLRP